MQVKLSQEEAQLLEIDFGEEIEKQAAARAEAISEAYEYGFDKHASVIADQMDKVAEEDEDEDEDKDEDEEMDEESEKAAAELGAFIERGFFDGLRKLGSERHENELYYLAPFLAEKIAAGKAKAAKGIMDTIRGWGEKVSPSAVAEEAKGAWAAGKKALVGKGKGGKQFSDKTRRAAAKEALIGAGKTVGRASPYVVGTGAAGYGGYKALGGGKKD